MFADFRDGLHGEERRNVGGFERAAREEYSKPWLNMYLLWEEEAFGQGNSLVLFQISAEENILIP